MDFGLTQEELKKYIHYDPLTGIFTRLTGVRKGLPVRCWKKDHGVHDRFTRVNILVFGINFPAAHLAFLYMTGKMPEISSEMHMDHINRLAWDNRWENLRLVTISENLRNGSPRKKYKTRVYKTPQPRMTV